MPETTVQLWNPTETAMVPVFDWSALRVKQERFGAQFLDIELRRDHQLSIIPDFYGYSFWVWRGPRLLFRGPVLKPTRKGGGGTAQSYVSLSVEGHLNNALRRRCVWTDTKADVGFGVTAPNSIAITLIDRCMGGVVGPIYPAGYPGGMFAPPFRTDYLTYTYMAGIAVGAPAPVTYNEQGGKNLQTVVEDLSLRYSMCPALNRTGVTQYQIDVQYPYLTLDRSTTICLTRLRGTSTAFEASRPFALTTVARVAGSGSGAAQTDAWASNNYPIYGVHEDQLTKPAGSAASCVNDTSLLMRVSSPLTSYRVQVRDTSNVNFGTDYFWREAVLVHDDQYLIADAQTIIGYTFEAWNGGRSSSVELEIAEPDIQSLKHMAGKTGMPFGHGAGDRWRDTRG